MFDVRCSPPSPFSVQRSTFNVRRSIALAANFLNEYTWLGLLPRLRLPLFFSLCFAASLLPFLPSSGPTAPAPGFPGWPESFEGRPLRRLPLAESERRFLEGFPGRVAKFTDGEREILLRWVAEPSRRLHPSADCLRGAGAAVRPLPAWRDRQGRLWGCQEMVRGGRRFRVRERRVGPARRRILSRESMVRRLVLVLGRPAGPDAGPLVGDHRGGEAGVSQLRISDCGLGIRQRLDDYRHQSIGIGVGIGIGIDYGHQTVYRKSIPIPIPIPTPIEFSSPQRHEGHEEESGSRRVRSARATPGARYWPKSQARPA